MVTPDEEYDQYAKDPRIPCKFGVQCYQRNPLHHQKYKHPPKKRTSLEDKKSTEEQSVKKRKVNKENDGEGQSNKPKVAASESEQSSNQSTDIAEKNVNQESSNGESSSSEKVKQVDDSSILRTPVNFNKKVFIKEKFLVDMPADFYLFWDFCKQLKANDPINALANVGLKLVGPYDVLADNFSNIVEKTPEEYLIHWRYYYDPPEFQTLIKGNDSTGYHIGYFRDDPNAPPVFLASNHAKKDGEFKCMGENIFAAVKLYLEEFKKSCDPFKKMSISKLASTIETQANKLNLNLSEKTPTIKERDKKILSRTFNKAGLVVPYNRKTQVGYRHLCVSDKELQKLLDRVVNASDQQKDKVMSEVQHVLTATSIATDECDFGTGIELGWDVLAHGVEALNSTIERVLTTAYELLQRTVFTKIIAAHMRNRRKGTNLSIL